MTSKAKKMTIMATGAIAATIPIGPRRSTIIAAKSPNSLISMCPANMFANNRTPRVIGLARYDTASTSTISGASQRGVPSGRNCRKNNVPLRRSPTLMMYTNTKRASANVMMR